MHSGEDGFCLMHFINDGVSVSRSTALIEFEGVGQFETFLCDLDRSVLRPCKEIILASKNHLYIYNFFF